MKNYALITKGIEDLLIESFENKDKKTINNLLTELKSNPKLKTLYAVVDNLKNGNVPPKKIDAFIKNVTTTTTTREREKRGGCKEPRGGGAQ